LKLIFYDTTHHLDSLIDSKNSRNNNNIKKECPASSLKVLGEPLILRNINMARKKLNFDKVLIPNGLHNALRIVQEAFPQIDVEEFSNEKDDRCYNNISNNSKRSITASSQPLYSKVIIGGTCKDFEIPLNACLHYSENIGSLFMESIIYPWDFLNLVQKVLHEEVTKNIISYFAGHDKISHQNVILDSIIGENVWFGGYSGTANVLLTQGNIRYEISKGDLMDTGTNHFGAVVGNDSAIGASVIILPGRQVPHSAMIQAGTIFGSKLLTNLT
jgi:hypothetical protein